MHVFALRPGRYVKRSHRARPLIGDGVLAPTGEACQRQRRLLQSQFTGRGMRRYEQRITEAAQTTAARWAGYARTGQVLDVGDEMRRFALDTIWRSPAAPACCPLRCGRVCSRPAPWTSRRSARPVPTAGSVVAAFRWVSSDIVRSQGPTRRISPRTWWLFLGRRAARRACPYRSPKNSTRYAQPYE
ncbi:cytochrome P450 [Streptomyces sp. NPDC058049]|uniref:cytochrome P450 n=1 Tax=Streptomyces sp. NPDC058049 TaxID=3346314 RepID=UPI0036EDDC1A